LCPDFCRNEVQNTSFEFICPFCFQPWYEDIKTKNEVCVNRSCAIYDTSLGIKDPRVSDELRDRVSKNHVVVTAALLQFDGSYIRQYLYAARRQMIKAMHDAREGINMPRFFALNELLLELNNLSKWRLDK